MPYPGSFSAFIAAHTAQELSTLCPVQIPTLPPVAGYNTSVNWLGDWWLPHQWGGLITPSTAYTRTVEMKDEDTGKTLRLKSDIWHYPIKTSS